MKAIFLLAAAMAGCAPAARNEAEPARNEAARTVPVRDSACAIRGAGQPGQGTAWSAVIIDGRILLDSPTSAGWASIETVAPRIDGNRRIYQTRYLTLAIEPAACAFREIYPALPDRVTIEWDSGRFEGCGGPRPAVDQIADTSWELLRIGADRAPTGRSPTIVHFGRNGSLGGTLSCNDGGIRSMWTGGGGFVAGPSGFEQTAVGCNDAAGETYGRRFWGGMETARAWRREGDRLFVTFADGSDAELRYLL